ncbi:hypothetical protein ABZ572_35230 [Streptomyces sp. NPDC018338]|uniref:hypothetical protein n=1 Tax=Streptomyces sp. NPDC018338 TaxID=3157192 RepID=UPI0034081BF5
MDRPVDAGVRRIDRWGHITGGMVPDAVTRAITRIFTPRRVPIAWTAAFEPIGGNSSGLASVARRAGGDGIVADADAVGVTTFA